MKKSIIAAAIATVVAAPVANAAVVVYGKVHLAVEYIDNTFWSAKSRSSYIGFKGSEDLTDDISLVWKAETTYQPLSDHGISSGWDSARSAYVGVDSNFGTVLYGMHDSPYKVSTSQLDFFAGQLADYHGTIGFKDIRANGTVAYVSPNMNGLTIAAAIVPENDKLVNSFSLASMYSNNDVYLSAAYESVNDNAKMRVGAGYTINDINLSAVYEDQDGPSLWQLSAAYNMGNNKIKAMVGKNSKGASSHSTSDDNIHNAWAIGLDHSFSNRTTGYIVYADSDYGVKGQKDATDGFSIGLIHKF